jgi:NTE family protein
MKTLVNGIIAQMRIVLTTMLMGLGFLVGCATPTRPPTLPTEPPAATTSSAGRVPKLGLALGGGAARGFAHVGVIQVLEEAGIRPDFVAGTSAGSLVAALYASGKTGAQLQQIALAMEESSFTDWTLPLFNRGMIKGDALARYVNAQVNGRLLENMVIPLGVVATDLGTGQAVLFQRGDTGTAVRASSAVPAVFQPVKIGAHDYVDGGLVSPVPVRYAHQMGADVVVAVDISSAPENNQAGDTFQVLLQTFAIMVRPVLIGVKSADFSVRAKAIEAGRTAMLEALPALRATLLKRMP